MAKYTLSVNGKRMSVEADADTPAIVGTPRPLEFSGNQIWLWCVRMRSLYGPHERQ
jgi:hypothetical protein